MYWKKNQVFFGLLFKIIMNNKRLWSYLRQITIGFTYTYRIINPLDIIIMVFIRFVLNYGFAKMNLMMKKRLRKFSLLCFHQIGSWSINIVLEISNVTQNLYKTSFRHRSMMNSLWEIITNVLLVRLHCPRSIIVQRVKKRCMKINHQRMLVNPRKAKETNTRRTNPKIKVRGKERNLSSATAVMVLIILQRSVIYPNTWLTYTRNPSKRLEKLKDRMKLTSMLHLMRLQQRASTLMKLQSHAWSSKTTLTERIWSSSTTQMMCLETKIRLHLSL
jgi:hypothetical protein